MAVVTAFVTDLTLSLSGWSNLTRGILTTNFYYFAAIPQRLEDILGRGFTPVR